MELIIKNKELQQALEREVETNLYLSGQLAEHEDRMEKLSIQREEELAA